jgi:hypothetical protein
MNGLDHAGWQVVGYVVSAIIGAALHWLFRKNDCTKCGIADLKAEIARLCNVVELLAEKVGLTVKERKEIESYHGGPI